MGAIDFSPDGSHLVAGRLVGATSGETAPVDDPSIAIAVFIEGSATSGESASGGSMAAPIASQLIEVWLSS